MQNEKTSTQRITRSRFLDRGESTISYGAWRETRSISLFDKSMNNKRVFMTTLFLVTGHIEYLCSIIGCGHDKKIHEITYFGVANGDFM